jgi:hypothetical protein
VDLDPILDKLRKYPEITSILAVIGNTPFNRYVAMMGMQNQEIFYTSRRRLRDGHPPAD